MFNPIFLTDEYFTNRNMKPCDDGDDADEAGSLSASAPAPDAPILSGQPAAAPDLSAVTGPISGGPTAPPAPAPQAPDANAVYSTDAQPPAMPVAAPSTNPPLPQNSRPTIGVSADGQSTIPQAAGTPSVWKQLVLGALIGATAGGRNFGQGAQLGGAKVQAMQDQQAQQAKDQQDLVLKTVQNNQDLKFKSLEAAANVAKAAKDAQQASDMHMNASMDIYNAREAANDEARNNFKPIPFPNNVPPSEETQQAAQDAQASGNDLHEDAEQYNKDHGGPAPYIISGGSPSEMNASAHGAMTTVQKSNGGSVPEVTTTNSVIGQGKDKTKHVNNAYVWTPDFITANPNAAVDRLNTANHVQNPDAPDLTWDQIKQMGANENPKNPMAGVQKLLGRADQSLFGTVPLAVPYKVDKDGNKTAKTPAQIKAENDTTLNGLDMQISRLGPNTTPDTAALLQKQRDDFDARAKYQESNHTDAEAAQKGADAQAEELGKENTPQGQATLAKTRAETTKTQQDIIATNNTNTPDAAGWVSPPGAPQLSLRQQAAANQKFATSKAFTDAQQAERSYQMSQNAYADHKAGKDNTGAQSMVELSTHLATTFGGVKGSRITKDMIQEHMNARSVSDDAQVAIQKLSNGDVLSDKQWDAFNDLIGQSRKLAWANATQTAHQMGVPMRSDILPQDLQSTPANSSANNSAKKADPNDPSQFGGKAH